MAPNNTDPRRPDRIIKYKPILAERFHPGETDSVGEVISVIAMFISMIALALKYKWACWLGLCLSLFSFGYRKDADELRQFGSTFMLSVISMVMSYTVDPTPMVDLKGYI